ncbi:MAG: helix-turn-helix transcriptional regulator [Bacilli bacterium]|nr:helix-turn-helix transcriptional regulator [Bacilli bacterium]
MDDLLISEVNKNKLQESLVTLRSIAGWNAEEFASLIGVSRQYYSELENHTRNLTQSMTLAILYVYEKEGKKNNDLNNVLKAILDEDGLTKEQCKSLSNYIASERKKKTTELNANRAVFAIIGATAASLVGIIVKSITKKVEDK